MNSKTGNKSIPLLINGNCTKKVACVGIINSGKKSENNTCYNKTQLCFFFKRNKRNIAKIQILKNLE